MVPVELASHFRLQVFAQVAEFLNKKHLQQINLRILRECYQNLTNSSRGQQYEHNCVMLNNEMSTITTIPQGITTSSSSTTS